MAAVVTNNSGAFAGGPSLSTTAILNVATGQSPLTTVAVDLIPAQNDAGVHNRCLLVNWTGDQTLDLLLQYDLGVSGNGFQTIASIHFVAGNTTTQTAMFYAGIGTTVASGTSLISGTQPTWNTAPAIGSWELLRADAQRIRVQAKAGGTTTVGVLTVDLSESP